MKMGFVGSCVLGVAVTTFFAANNAAVGMIGVDFNHGGATNQSPGSADVVGPVASAGWNNFINVSSGPLPGTIALADNTNTTTSATLAFKQGGTALNGYGTYNSAYGAVGAANGALDANQQLFNGAAVSEGFTQEITIKDVPYATFDIYVLVKAPVGNQGYGNAGYFGESSLQIFNGATAGTTYYFGSSNQNPIPASGFSYIKATSTTISSPTLEANYVLFSGLTGGIGSNYSFDLRSPSGAEVGNPFYFNGNGLLTGVQIVNAESAAVPEPASIALLGSGAMLLLKRRRV